MNSKEYQTVVQLNRENITQALISTIAYPPRGILGEVPGFQMILQNLDISMVKLLHPMGLLDLVGGTTSETLGHKN